MNWVRGRNSSSPKLRFRCLGGSRPEDECLPLLCGFELLLAYIFILIVNFLIKNFLCAFAHGEIFYATKLSN